MPKKLYSLDVSALWAAPLVGWLVSVDNATVNAVAIAVVWVYFEIQRKNDAKQVAKVAADKAAPLEVVAQRLETKIGLTTGRLEALEGGRREGDSSGEIRARS